MALLESAPNLSHPLDKLDQAVGARLRRLSKRVAVFRQYRTARTELLQYNPQELCELGISDADIDNVARASARGAKNEQPHSLT
ncbi:MAG: hypothetical protein GY798_17200 [Hyphomicrobiales bacterium]|nr:hypothetical protein [Hyphomicrobiales bacterium]